MRVWLVTVICGVSLVCATPVLRARPAPRAEAQEAPAASPDAVAIVRRYCAGCHSGGTRSPSGAPLDVLDPSRMAADAEVWARASRQLRAGAMPPAGASRPDRDGYEVLLRAIDGALGAHEPLPRTESGRVATRLASLLWDGPPDAALREDARAGRLSDRAVVEEHAARLLADERADAFVTGFFVPWLGLERLDAADPDAAAFPGFDRALRDAMATETRLFLRSQLREDRDPLELWTAAYTYVNGPLARHYGMAPGVTGDSLFRRVALPDGRRAGLLGHGSVLMITSRHQHGPDAAYTSPAARAIWIRSRFFGASPPRPFPGAEPVRPDLPITPQTRTLPEQPCVQCHRNFFPLGYALEHFDPVGRWRETDQAGPVDASGQFVDGTHIDGLPALRNVMVRHAEAFRTTLVERLLLHASGVPMRDAPTKETLARARQILRQASPARWSSIVAGVVQNGP